MQLKQDEWHKQWEMFRDEELFLFKEWIYPNTLDDFRNKDVLECGCGGGQHTSFVAGYAQSVTAVDLNTVDIARRRNENFRNINFVEADIAAMNLLKQFEIVFSIGVIHHTDNPDITVENLKKHLKTGGKLILWVYSKEGNFLVCNFLEPIRKKFLQRIAKTKLLFLSKLTTFLLSIPVYSIYLLPLSWLPYYQYFENFRKLSFSRNTLNVFDKLNAPQVQFITEDRFKNWFNPTEFANITISRYKNVSWRGSGIKK